MDELVFAASVFTSEPDPPCTVSPWTAHATHLSDGAITAGNLNNVTDASLGILESTSIHPASVLRLAPEPQEGPTEYKLHLLLRPRRHFTSSSTGLHISGSKSFQPPQNPLPQNIPPPPSPQTTLNNHNPPPASSSSSSSTTRKRRPPTHAPLGPAQTRAARLQSLTTQLLWRLQQSSPCHHLPGPVQGQGQGQGPGPTLRENEEPLTEALFAEKPRGSALFAPSAVPPRNTSLGAPTAVVHKEGGDGDGARGLGRGAVARAPAVTGAGAELRPQLMNTRGAYYELGVADDGALIGLLEEEVAESLETLRMMAASLGCGVELQRKVCVGWAGWDGTPAGEQGVASVSLQQPGRGDLWVVEAFVRPEPGHDSASATDATPVQ